MIADAGFTVRTASLLLLFYAPGLALVAARATRTPLLFARVATSVMVTTLVATMLAAFGRFSLEALLAANAAACVLALALRRGLAADSGSAPEADRVGPLVAALALAALLPAYPVFLGASDSTAYVTTGVSLARHGTLWREDRVGASLPPAMRAELFDSMSQVIGAGGPPFRRMPGAMLLPSLDSTRAWPAFFPVPSVWAAVFASIFGVAAAPAYSAVFAALMLWAFFLLARAWLGSGYGTLATVLLAATSAFQQSARLPMSETIAGFFVLGGLACFAAASRSHGRGDFALAGAMLGAAVFTRMETAVFLALAFALAGRLGARPIFHAALLSVGALSAVQLAAVPGSYLDPIRDHVTNAGIVYFVAVRDRPLEVASLLAAAAAILALSTWRLGLLGTARIAVVGGVLVGHAAASNFLVARTPTWLSFTIGWGGLATGALGAVLAWRRRDRLDGAPLVLGLAAAFAMVLFYNPHVFPTLPWGWRRYVPVLLPSLLLLASFAVSRVGARSRLAAAALLVALVAGIAPGARAVAGRTQFEGAFEALEAVDRALAPVSVVLYDRDISGLMLGPALWLVKDRQGLAMWSTQTAAGRERLAATYHFLRSVAPLRAVYLVTRGVGEPIMPAGVAATRVARVPVSLPLLEQAVDRRPEKMERYLMPLAVYRLSPAPPKAPTPAGAAKTAPTSPPKSQATAPKAAGKATGKKPGKVSRRAARSATTPAP